LLKLKLMLLLALLTSPQQPATRGPGAPGRACPGAGAIAAACPFSAHPL